MKKLFSVLAVLLFACSMSAEVRYEKVKNEGQEITDWSGRYLIVREVNDSTAIIFNGGLDEEAIDAKSGNAILNLAIDTLEDGTKYLVQDSQLGLTDSLENAEFTIAKIEDTDFYSVLSHSGMYIGHKDTADNGLSAETELKSKCHNTIQFESETASKVLIKAYSKSGENDFAVRFDDEKNRFRYFAWDGAKGEYKKKAIWLYERVEYVPVMPEALVNGEKARKATKVIRNGKMIIVRNGVNFDILGNIL